MSDQDRRFRRPDPKGSTQRDVERFRRREPDQRFYRYVALVGSAGWPIVLLATGGALLGRYIDARMGTGIHLTLILLTLGTIFGSMAAYRSLRGDGR